MVKYLTDLKCILVFLKREFEPKNQKYRCMKKKGIVSEEAPPTVISPEDRRGDSAQQRADRSEKKRKIHEARVKAGKEGTHLNLYFLSISKHGKACMHIVHEELFPFKMPTPSTVDDFVGEYAEIEDFEVHAVEGHPDSIIVHVKQGQPIKEGLNIYTVGLEVVVPKESHKPVHQAIWRTTEKIKRKKQEEDTAMVA